jgi:hypothetical protein
MTPTRQSSRATAWVLAGAAALVVTLAVVFAWGSPAWHNASSLQILAAFAGAIAVGEWFRVTAPGFRESAPTGTAAAFGLVFAVEVPEGHRVTYGALVVIAVTGVAMAMGTLARRLAGLEIRATETVGRFVAVVVVAVLYRSVHLGQQAGEIAPDDGLEPWQQAVLMLGISVVGLLVHSVFTSSASAGRGAGAWRRAFLDDVRATFGLASALAVTGALIALAARPLGLLALPLFLVPLILTQLAFRRYVGILATYRQSIGTLSRLTDLAGYTAPGHSERVAELAVAVGRELAVSERELLDLEYAVLLHDIGQVALIEPIPGGATVLAAPADQRRIARDTVDIVRETGVLDDVAEILEHQATPFRQMRELDEEIPLASRITLVCDAFHAMTSDRPYRRSLGADRARAELRAHAGTQFCPRSTAALLELLDPA